MGCWQLGLSITTKVNGNSPHQQVMKWVIGDRATTFPGYAETSTVVEPFVINHHGVSSYAQVVCAHLSLAHN
jgi:hypothetical protein